VTKRDFINHFGKRNALRCIRYEFRLEYPGNDESLTGSSLGFPSSTGIFSGMSRVRCWNKFRIVRSSLFTSARVGERSAKESFRRLPKRSRYRFSLAKRQWRDLSEYGETRFCVSLEDDQLQDFSARPFFLPRLFSSGTALYHPMVDNRIATFRSSNVPFCLPCTCLGA